MDCRPVAPHTQHLAAGHAAGIGLESDHDQRRRNQALKVFALPDGTLLPNYRQGARQSVDDAWWQDVLLDPRAYTPVNETRFDEHSPYAHYRLDRQPYDTVAFSCGCGMGTVVDKTSLIRQMGGDANVLWVARHMIDCGRRNKISNGCRAYCQR
jgi:hypothetical protein